MERSMKVLKAVWTVVLLVWVAPVTLFAQKAPVKLLAEDGQVHGLGLLYKSPATIPSWHRLDTKTLAVSAPALPASVINTAYLPPVGDQGGQGSCVAWATAYYNKTYMEAKEHGWDPSQLADQYSPAYIYNQGHLVPDNGMYFDDATEILTHLGCATLDQMPYTQSDDTTWPSEAAYQEAMSYRIGTTTWVDTTQPGALTAVKQWLSQGNVAFAGLYLYVNFYDISSYGENYCLADVTGANAGGHATTIIGYDDNHVTNDGVGAFRCVNSWGTGWGDQGFYWLSYQAVTDTNHKISQGYVTYWQELVGDSPTVAAKFQVSYGQFRDLRVTLSAGSQQIVLWNLYAWQDGSSRNLALAAPAHPIWVDLSDLAGPSYTLSVTDSLNGSVSGALSSFSVVRLAGNVDTASPDPPLAIAPPDTPVLVPNGGFESGLSDWNPGISQGGTTPGITTTTVHSGSNAAFLSAGGTTAGDSSIAKVVSVPAGGASLLAWYYPLQQNPGSADYQAAQAGHSFDFLSNAQSWTPVYMDLAPYASQNIWVYFWTWHDGTTSGSTSMAVDDIAFLTQHPALASVTIPSAPVVSSLAPFFGPPAGGTSVVIAGANFMGATSVMFGAAPATSYTVTSDTQITVVSPAYAAGTVDVTVTTPAGTSNTSTADQFTYTLNTYSLTVSKTGSGSGTATSSPAGISCGTTCSASFPYNTAVNLTPAPDASSVFVGWSGEGCSGTGNCQVTMTQARNVTATFTVLCPLPTISTLSASPVLVSAGGASTLTWSTSGATGVTLNAGGVGASGSTVVHPTVTTPYTLLATNACGSTSQTVTVNVNSGTGGLATPTITTPSAGQTLLNGGVSFAWGAVGGATGYDLRLFGGGSGQTVFSGSLDGGGSTSALLSLPDGAYTFAVRACSGAPSDATCGAFGSVSFSISSPAPSGVPTVTFPTQGATLSTSTQTLTWTSVAKVDPASPMQYQLVLTDITTGLAELQISVLDATSTIFSLRSSSHYQLKVRACQAGCGAWSVPVDFAVTLPPIPTSVPVITNATVSGGNSLSVWWTGVANADLYQIQVVQPTSGPGGGALTVAAMQVSATTVTLPIPQGDATIFVWGCTGDGCGPQSAGWDITAPGPNPSTPNLGTPLAGSSVTGPTVNFSWNRIPGDTGSNTEYRLYVGDNARSRPALDVYTTANYYAANFKAEGTRYDALVIANPRTASPVQGPATGFLVRGPSGLSPTMVQPAYGFAVPHGNVQVEWTPIPGASVYEYYLSQRVTPPATPVTFQGVTPGLSVQVPLKAIGGVNTNYLGIVRACPQGATCTAASDAGWGIWSNQPGGGGLVEFTVTP